MQTSLHDDQNLSHIDDAYNKFADVLFLERRQTLDLNIFYNIACYTQVEFKQLHKQLTDKKSTSVIEYLEKAILLVNTQLTFAEHGLLLPARAMHENNLPILKWMGSKLKLVELGYSLHETKIFGKASLKEIFDVLCKIFDCEIINYHRLFWDIRNRKGDKTPFLTEMKEGMDDKFISMDK